MRTRRLHIVPHGPGTVPKTRRSSIIVALADASIAAKFTTAGVIIEDGGKIWTIKLDEPKSVPSGNNYSARLPKNSGLILHVTDASGVELDTKKFQIRRGGKVIVKVTAKATAVVQHQPAAPTSDSPDRRAARWVLGIGGTIETDKGIFTDVAKLPKEPFRIVRIDLPDNRHVTDDDLEHLKGNAVNDSGSRIAALNKAGKQRVFSY